MGNIRIFISYSHKEKIWMEEGRYELIPYLKRSLAKFGVEFWHDRELRQNIGERYQKKIVAEIERADLAVLLISQDFLNSTFIQEIEMPLIKKRVDQEELGIIPILVDFANAKLSPIMEWINDRQILPSDPPEPLNQFVENHPKWAKVRADILDAFIYRIERIRKKSAAQDDQPKPYPDTPDLNLPEEAPGPQHDNIFEEIKTTNNPAMPEPSSETPQEPTKQSVYDTSEPFPGTTVKAPLQTDLTDGPTEPFDTNKQLATNLFAFNLSNVLVRAAKRRNFQKRACITPLDLISGMVRKGDLTRTVLLTLKLNPDEVYQSIGSYTEAGDAPAPDRQSLYNQLSAQFMAGKISKEGLSALLNFWYVRNMADFNAGSQAVLQQAAARSSQEKRTQIDELDLLETLLKNPAWDEFAKAGLPTTTAFAENLKRVLASGRVDQNGNWNFEGLDNSASMVIGRAHTLAQKYGYSPISHRVMLASLIYEENGFGRSLLTRLEKNPDQIIGYLLGTLSNSVSDTFGLSYEVCQRLITPMIENAQKTAGSQQPITDEHLFNAFLQLASEPFKAWLLKGPATLNLDELRETQVSPGTTIH